MSEPLVKYGCLPDFNPKPFESKPIDLKKVKVKTHCCKKNRSIDILYWADGWFCQSNQGCNKPKKKKK